MLKGFVLAAVIGFNLFAQPPAPNQHGKVPPGRSRHATADGKKIVFLPRLLTENFHKAKDVCEDAKKKGKAYCLLALKTHGCDCGLSCNYCLDETRNISDPANRFILDHFAAYHTRLYRSKDLADFGKKELGTDSIRPAPGTRAVASVWVDLAIDFQGNTRDPQPGLLILDASSCSIVGFITMKDIAIEKDSKGKTKNRLQRAQQTNDQIRSALLKLKPITPEIRAIVDDNQPALDEKLMKIYPEASLAEYTQLLDAQLAAEDPEGKKFLEEKE